jgi:hypothetical protein
MGIVDGQRNAHGIRRMKPMADPEAGPGRRNPFAESDDRRRDPPGSVPGTGIHRQLGATDIGGGPAGRGWSLAQVGADRLFLGLAAALVAIGLVVWLLASLLG